MHLHRASAFSSHQSIGDRKAAWRTCGRHRLPQAYRCACTLEEANGTSARSEAMRRCSRECQRAEWKAQSRRVRLRLLGRRRRPHVPLQMQRRPTLPLDLGGCTASEHGNPRSSGHRLAVSSHGDATIVLLGSGGMRGAQRCGSLPLRAPRHGHWCPAPARCQLATSWHQRHGAACQWNE
jgi:hypothetical protein